MIKINYHIIDDSKDEIIDISCHRDNCEKMKAIARELVDGRNHIVCKKNGNTYKIRIADILYIETVDDRLFIYCLDAVYENRMRLYEAEEICKDALFFKASKSMLINLKKIDNLKPSISGRFEITMNNGEKLLVSRKYVSELKNKMNL